MQFSGTSMAEDFPGTTMGFSFAADTIGAAVDPHEDSFDYVKWQSSQTACQALNQLIMTSANEPRLKVRLKEDELGIGTDSKGWQRQPSFDQIPEFSLLSTNDVPSTSFGPSSKPSSSSSSKPSSSRLSSSKPSSSRSSSSKPSSRPPRSRPRPSETKSRPSTKTLPTNPDTSSAPLNKTNPERLLDVIKGMKTHVDLKAGVVHPRRSSAAGSVASSSSSTRVARTSTVAAAAATTTRKRARHPSDGRNSSSDSTSQHGQAKRGRVVLDKGKARASIDGLEMQKGREMAKEKEKDVHIPPSRAAASGSGTASSSLGSGSSSSSSKPEGTSDTSPSMEVDEGDTGLADRSTRSWTTASPSLLGSSSSLSSAESRSPSQKRMPPPPVPFAAKLLAAKANGHPSRRGSVGGSAASSSRATTILVPTQKETNLDSKVVPKLHPLLQNPPTKPSAPIISNSYSSGRQTKVNHPSRQPPAVPSPDIPPRAISNATTIKVKTEPSYAKPVQPQPQAQPPQAQPLRSMTSSKPLSGGTSALTARTSSVATTITAARTPATNLPSTPHGATQSQPQQLTLSQSMRPPPLGMRRTNTFPVGGVGTGIGQKTGALPTKQKGFRVPFMNGGVGSQQQQLSVVTSGAAAQGGASTSNASSNSNSKLTSAPSFSPVKSKPNEHPSTQAVVFAPAPPPPVPAAAVPALELPGPTDGDGDGDSSFDMSLSFDMDALEETMRLYD